MRKAFIQSRNVLGYASLFLMFIFFGCTQESVNIDNPEKKNEKNKHFTTLQEVVNNANVGEEIDLTEYESITDYNAVISKQLVIKNGSLSNAKLVIDSENIKLDKVKSVSVTTLSASSLTITDRSIDELLLIGKNYSDNNNSRSSKSYSFIKESCVTMNGMSTVNNVTMNFSKAKLKISEGSSAETVAVLDDAVISGEIEELVIKELNTSVVLEKANIENVVMDGFNSQLAVLDVATILKNISINTECKILLNAIMSDEMEMTFNSDGCLTIADMTKKPQLKRLYVSNMPTDVFANNGEIDFSGLKVCGEYENVATKVYTNTGISENIEVFTKLETDYDIEVISEENGIITVRVSKDGKECTFGIGSSRTLVQAFEAGCSGENNTSQDGVSYSAEKGYGVVTVSNPESSGSVWDYYIRSKDIAFESGKNYMVSVDLKADKTSVVAIAAARADMFFTVGTEWTTYTFETGYLETAIAESNQNCITIGSGLVGTLSVSNLVITETENDGLPALSFFIEKNGITDYLASDFATKNIVEVEKAKDETGTKVLGYKLTLNSTGVSLQLRDYAPVSENKLNRATFNMKTDNSKLTSAVVASVDNLSNGYISYWNEATVIGENKKCEVYFPSYSEETSGSEQCVVQGIISGGQIQGNTITITDFGISNVEDLANTGKTFAIKNTDKDKLDVWSKSTLVPFSVNVTVPVSNEIIFDVLLGDEFDTANSGSFNWKNVTRFLYQKTFGEFIEGSSLVKYEIGKDGGNPIYKLVNTSDSDVTCIITLTKDLKVEIEEKSSVP